ncbi:MAG: hypothetical protein IJC18_02710, partial [Clostridia bacterium]|nr:hypothetical protein [Clostridia bacterium]
MERKNFNEVLKEKERLQKAQLENVQDDKPLALDDSQRVKVLSPGQMVFKRFIRNRLAIVGSAILIFMFLFAFLFPLFYQHGQTDIFYKYDDLVIDYASASERTEYTSYVIDPEIEVHYSVAYMISTFAAEMNKTGSDVLTVYGTDEQAYIVEKLGDNVYTISAATAEPVATYDGVVASYNKGDGTIAYRGADLGDDFASAVADTLSGSEIEFTFDEHIYLVEPSDINNVYNVISVDNGTMSVSGSVGDDFMEQFVANVEAGAFVCDGKYYNIIESYDGSITIEEFSDKRPALLSSLYVFDAYDGAPAIDDNFRVAALLSMQNEGNFSFDGTDYVLVENDGAYSICKADDTSAPLYELNTFSIRRYSGEDTLSIDFKNLAKKTIQDMKDAGTTTSQFVYQLPQMDDEGQYVYDEDGNLTLVDTDITVTQKGDMYVFNCEQVTYLIDIYADSSLKKGSWDHIFGTDADGMDVLARMMYGGRISLMVGFVVVIIEVILGVILGGIAGFFGGWVDTLIMRLVDIFYCIPSMPILIILG